MGTAMTEAGVEVAYDGQPHGLVFTVGDRRLQLVSVHNRSTGLRMMVKIQSTSPRKFRVRPGFVVLSSLETVVVQIQLAPHERDASECKFLLVARCIDPADEGNPEARGSDVDDKTMWKRAEARHEASLVLSETIVARILIESGDKPTADPLVNTQTRPESPPDAPLRVDSLETRAQVVVLLMKNQSRLQQNQLSNKTKTALQRLRETSESDWQTLEGYARRMRILARQFAQRAQSAER